VNQPVSTAGSGGGREYQEEERRQTAERERQTRELAEQRRKELETERAQLTAQLAALPPCSDPTQQEIMVAQFRGTYQSIADRQDNCKKHRVFKGRLADLGV
jgi:uncharacterized protein involved in exopolysaccharide biosynthesis